MRKRKILFLTTQLPYPPVSGGVIKTWRLVNHWAVQADLKVLTLLKNDDAEMVGSFLSNLNGRIEFKGIEFQKERTALNLLKSYLASSTLNVYRNATRKMGDAVNAWSRDAEIIFIDHYEMGQYVPAGFRGKVILHEHNAEYVMWKRLAEIESNPLKRLILNLEARRIGRTEIKYIERSDKTLAAPNDRDELVKIGASLAKFETTYHLGEDEMLSWPNVAFHETDENILFVGTLTWEANIDGLLWWFEEVWPKVKAQNNRVSLTIIGKNPDHRILEATRGDARVKIAGFVEDLRPYYDKGRVFIVPLRFGSGIKVKLLNAMYRGIPTVTTSIGTEGLELESGKELYYTSDPEKFGQDVLTLLSNEDRWTMMRDASRLKAKEYSWDALLKAHDDLIENILEHSK